MIPSETASEGAAITFGRFGGGAGALAGSGRDGSRKVASKPDEFFDFEELDLEELEAEDFVLACEGCDCADWTEAVLLLLEFVFAAVVEVPRLFAGFAALADAAVVPSALGGASSAAALARNLSHPASFPPSLR
jgi:hypothetical protein